MVRSLLKKYWVAKSKAEYEKQVNRLTDQIKITESREILVHFLSTSSSSLPGTHGKLPCGIP